MGKIIPGEDPEALAKRKAEETKKAMEADLVEWKEKIFLVGDDLAGLAQLSEKAEYWRDKEGEAFAKAGGGFDTNMYRIIVSRAAVQDMFDIMDPSGALKKKYDILFSVHAKQYFQTAQDHLASMKEKAAQQEAHSFMEQEAHRRSLQG